MKTSSRIITVGLCPAWDITCKGEGLDWGEHKQISRMSCRPAGKALNISRALAWMGEKSVAAGLWGRTDYEQMLKAMQPLKKWVRIEMSAVAGATRRNITVVDTVNKRDMHLRNRSELASKSALRRLKIDLRRIVSNNSICVFAGAMPEKELWPDALGIVKLCGEKGARLAVDTSREALREIVEAGSVWLISPNVEELSELLGERIRDNPSSLAKGGRKLLNRVEIVLISRGEKGAVVVSKGGAWQGRRLGRREVLSTLCCGDYLLAGFLKGLMDKSNFASALQLGIKVATAKAWGWTDEKQWRPVERQISVQVSREQA